MMNLTLSDPSAGTLPSQDSNGVDLATTMMLRGAVGALTGAACGPKGQTGLWAAAGFFVGSTLGQAGIVSILLAALWKKAG